MRVSLQLTLDDLVRTLRGKAHVMAEEIESGYSQLVPMRPEAEERRAKGERDDISRA